MWFYKTKKNNIVSKLEQELIGTRCEIREEHDDRLPRGVAVLAETGPQHREVMARLGRLEWSSEHSVMELNYRCDELRLDVEPLQGARGTTPKPQPSHPSDLQAMFSAFQTAIGLSQFPDG